MELLRLIDNKEATNNRNKNKKSFETLRVGMSFSVVFFTHQAHRATRRYGYLSAENIMQIFGSTDHIILILQGYCTPVYLAWTTLYVAVMKDFLDLRTGGLFENTEILAYHAYRSINTRTYQ